MVIHTNMDKNAIGRAGEFFAAYVLERYADCHKLILTLTVRFPKQSLARRLLALITRSLPSLLLPASRRGRPQHAMKNCTRFLQGDWQALWQQALLLAKKEYSRSGRSMSSW